MKYKLTQETIEYKGHILHRIEALKDFASVRQGDKGRFVESETNLSQDGNCWISSNAKVYENAKVFENAIVFDDAQVYGDAQIYGNARIYEEAKICDNSEVHSDAEVYENAKIYGHANIFENTKVYGNAKVYGDAEIYGNAEIYGHAKVANMRDYIVFKNWWSSGRYLTWTRSNNKWHVGCFYGTGKELVAKAYKDSELSGREYKQLVDYVESILRNNKGGEK